MFIFLITEKVFCVFKSNKWTICKEKPYGGHRTLSETLDVTTDSEALWEESLGPTQNSLEGWWISSGPGPLGILQEELESVAGVKDVWRTCCQHNATPEKAEE